jgi:hypothetical protein
VLKQLRRRLRPVSKDEIHKYWRAPDDGSNQNLTGIELSEQAVEVLRREFPHIADVWVGAAEDILPTFDRFDLVFTMAVLVHIHPCLSRRSSASLPGSPRSSHSPRSDFRSTGALPPRCRRAAPPPGYP